MQARRALRVGLALCFAACAVEPGSGAALGSSDAGSASTAGESGGSEDTGHHAHADSTGAGPSGRYHPVGFEAADVHGLATKLGEEDCRDCHGSDLSGGTSLVNCDACHEPGWRTDCVFCHGGQESPLGAPPRDIDGSVLLDELSFQAHTSHVSESNHAVFDCSQCHRKPVDVLSPGHLFDGTPAVAEVDFSAGLSPQGMWAAGTCGSLYCHGNGNDMLGAFEDGSPTPGCGDCHGYSGATNVPVGTMSGAHLLHITEGLACSECHGATVDETGAITQPLLHVNGFAEVAIAEANVSWNGASCTGLCHLKAHFAQSW